jgi:hypothetical protein
MDKVEKTKESLKVDDIHEDDRKRLFKKFVEHGGEVIDEKTKRKNLVIDRERQKDLKKRTEERQRQNRRSSTAKKEVKKPSAKTGKRRDQKDSVLRQFFNRLMLRIKLKWLNVTQLNGFYFNIKFLERFNNTYKPAFIEIQMQYLDIFKSNPGVSKKIVANLDRIKPLLYELIEITSNLYDNITVNQIVDHYKNFPDVPKNISELKEPLMAYYRKLYILKPYENSALTAFERALVFQSKIDNKKNISYSQQRRKIKNALYLIFHKLFPRLHWLFCHYEGKIFEIDDREIEKILKITSDDIPGHRHSGSKKDRERDEIKSDGTGDDSSPDEESKENEELSESIRVGLRLMSKLDLKKLKHEFYFDDVYKILSIRDKVLITYLLFREFDKEYSFILTTNKIKYRIDISQKNKLDFKSRMQEYYDLTRKCFSLFKDYASVSNDYKKMEGEKPMTNTQYMQHSRRLADTNKKRTQSAQNARNAVKSYMDRLSSDLEVLIEDYHDEKKLIENPDDVLEFIPQIEGEKKINGKTISQAIVITYNFAAALSHRLGFGGDLTGNIEFDTEEQIRKGLEGAGTHSEGDEEKEVIGSLEESDKSILDELDDIL